MTTKEIKAQIKAIKDCSKAIKSSPKSSREFLVRLGTHTKTGQLTSHYKS